MASAKDPCLEDKERGAVMESATSVPAPHWRVWDVVAELKSKNDSRYQSASREVASVLEEWAHRWAGNPAFGSLLNKRMLLKETEESIIAIQYLLEYLSSITVDDETKTTEFTLVDLCCGKGIFSMLLIHMAARSSTSPICRPLAMIRQCILVDRATPKDIDWSHLSDNAPANSGVELQIWDSCNIHDEVFTDRLQSVPGKEKCPFLCLAPCCLPRVARQNKTNTKSAHKKQKMAEREYTIEINLYEAENMQKARKEAMMKRTQALGERATKKDPSLAKCSVCDNMGHRWRDCPTLPSDEEEQIRILKEVTLHKAPCWKCGTIGHVQSNCPSTQTTRKPVKILPPTQTISVTNVLSFPDPFGQYCTLLATTIQLPEKEGSLEIQEAILSGKDHNIDTSKKNDDKRNWNAKRKSKYIIATR
eukprot:scaffold233258_cov55-Attheya_sp.AAC.3